MPVTPNDLKDRKQDYFLARWENEELIMEPFCHCGNELEENYYCEKCQHQCSCTFIACKDLRTLSVVQKFVHGNPKFRGFEASLLEWQS